MDINLPDNTRVIDLIRLANAQGKRLIWRRQGFRYRAQLAHPETANDSQYSNVTRLRPRLRVVSSQNQ